MAKVIVLGELDPVLYTIAKRRATMMEVGTAPFVGAFKNDLGRIIYKRVGEAVHAIVEASGGVATTLRRAFTPGVMAFMDLATLTEVENNGFADYIFTVSAPGTNAELAGVYDLGPASGIYATESEVHYYNNYGFASYFEIPTSSSESPTSASYNYKQFAVFGELGSEEKRAFELPEGYYYVSTPDGQAGQIHAYRTIVSFSTTGAVSIGRKLPLLLVSVTEDNYSSNTFPTNIAHIYLDIKLELLVYENGEIKTFHVLDTSSREDRVFPGATTIAGGNLAVVGMAVNAADITALSLIVTELTTGSLSARVYVRDTGPLADISALFTPSTYVQFFANASLKGPAFFALEHVSADSTQAPRGVVLRKSGGAGYTVRNVCPAVPGLDLNQAVLFTGEFVFFFKVVEVSGSFGVQLHTLDIGTGEITANTAGGWLGTTRRDLVFKRGKAYALGRDELIPISKALLAEGIPGFALPPAIADQKIIQFK